MIRMPGHLDRSAARLWGMIVLLGTLPIACDEACDDIPFDDGEPGGDADGDADGDGDTDTADERYPGGHYEFIDANPISSGFKETFRVGDLAGRHAFWFVGCPT